MICAVNTPRDRDKEAKIEVLKDMINGMSHYDVMKTRAENSTEAKREGAYKVQTKNSLASRS